MSMRHIGGAILVALLAGTGCELSEPGVVQGSFTPDPDDEAVDPSDPPVDPDPFDDGDETGVELAATCPARSMTLSPKGLTFVIHISKDSDQADRALEQLEQIRPLIRARDVFMVERKAPVLASLRALFPCNDIHFIAYPDEFAAALDAGDLVDGIAIDWEGGDVGSPAHSVDRLHDYARTIHDRGQMAGYAPSWSNSFDDGRITRGSHMNYELAQIQARCAHVGARSFARAARARVEEFLAAGIKPRDLGVEISMDSYDSADNHTSVDESVKCTRKAYGKGARAIYIYGNGKPHLADYFTALEAIGLREPR
jgi:hypothetical protein